MSLASAIRRVVAWVLVVVMGVGSPVFAAPAFAQQSTRFVHTPITGFVPGFRINVKAAVSSPAGVAVVRCYFRAKGEADFVFVDMASIGSDQYLGVLPAPSQATEEITYILLAVSGDRAVVRTQAFKMVRQEGSQPTIWQTSNMSGQVSVSTELAQAPQAVAGFTDSIAADVAESALRFGYVVEGLYTVSQMVGPAPVGYQGAVALATPAPPSATPPSPQVQAKPAPSTPAAAHGGSGIGWVLLAGAAVAAGGGVAYWKLRDGNKLTAKSIVGNWSYTGLARGYTLTGTISFASGGTFTYNAVASAISTGRTGTGSWTLTGTTISIYENEEGWTLSGTFTGDKNSFTVSGSAGTYTFTRR